jgi:hypothetical protein
VKVIGSAVRGNTNIKVILGTVFIDVLLWFLQVSGISEHQVASGVLAIHAYPTKAVTLPIHPPTGPELLSKSNTAYVDGLRPGSFVQDNGTDAAKQFAQLYNSSGVSTCGFIVPRSAFAPTLIPLFPAFAACELLNWPEFKDIDVEGELWSLAVAAGKEILTLSIHGEVGQKVAKSTTRSTLISLLIGWESQMLPLDLREFYKYHHGGKVNVQDRAYLRACLSRGEVEGVSVSGLRELIRRLEK